jgi:hypothetical protein
LASSIALARVQPGVKYRKSGSGWFWRVGRKSDRAEEVILLADTDMAAVELKSAAQMCSPPSEQSIM